MGQQRERLSAAAGGPEGGHLEALASPGARPGRAQVWAIASGKGGVGRSFLTANLGCVLARGAGPVTLVDLDFSGGNLHTFLAQSVGPAGIGAFFQGDVGLEALARSSEVPDLRLIQGSGLPGAGGLERLPNGRARVRLLNALRRLDTSVVMLDLESGGSRAVLDFFTVADRPLLVVLPEPAAVENAHRFIRQVYLRRLESLARSRGVDRATFSSQVVPRENWRPGELLSRLERLRSGLGEELQRELEAFSLYLLMNQAHHISDVGVGLSLKKAVQSYFGIRVRYVGAIRHDQEAWWSVRRRRIRVRESTGDDLAMQLEQVAQRLLNDVELEVSGGAASLPGEGL